LSQQFNVSPGNLWIAVDYIADARPFALFEKWDADSSHQGLGLSAASERDTCAWKKRIEQAGALQK
jgi:hypothetical protein